MPLAYDDSFGVENENFDGTAPPLESNPTNAWSGSPFRIDFSRNGVLARCDVFPYYVPSSAWVRYGIPNNV